MGSVWGGAVAQGESRASRVGRLGSWRAPQPIRLLGPCAKRLARLQEQVLGPARVQLHTGDGKPEEPGADQADRQADEELRKIEAQAEEVVDHAPSPAYRMRE